MRRQENPLEADDALEGRVTCQSAALWGGTRGDHNVRARPIPGVLDNTLELRHRWCEMRGCIVNANSLLQSRHTQGRSDRICRLDCNGCLIDATDFDAAPFLCKGAICYARAERECNRFTLVKPT